MARAQDKPLKGVRPTTGKVLESLLAILAPDLLDARAVDLFAGTGRVGLGFLEQGAARVDFVEADAKVASVLQGRLKAEEPDRARWRLLRGTLPAAARRLEGRYGIFWADPPYDWNGVDTLLPALAPFAEPGALLVVEHHHKTAYGESEGWELYRQEKHGETRLSFFQFGEADSGAVDPPRQPEDGGHEGDEDGDGR